MGPIQTPLPLRENEFTERDRVGKMHVSEGAGLRQPVGTVLPLYQKVIAFTCGTNQQIMLSNPFRKILSRPLFLLYNLFPPSVFGV